MSATRRKFSTEYKVEAEHRVIDSARSITVVARELGILQCLWETGCGRNVVLSRQREEQIWSH